MVSVHNEYGELKECVLADFYTHDFWNEWFRNSKGVESIIDKFKRISDEVLEDLAVIESTLVEHGVKVYKPDTADMQYELVHGGMSGQDDNVNSTTIMDLLSNVDAPVTPGYDLWVCKDKLYTSVEKNVEYKTLFSNLESKGTVVERDPNNTSLKKFPFQSVQRLGNTIWIDSEELSEQQIDVLTRLVPDAEYIKEPDNGQNFIKWIREDLVHYSGHDYDKGPEACKHIKRIYSSGQTSAKWLKETKNITDQTQFTDNAISEMLKLCSNKWWYDRYAETGDDNLIKEVDAFLQYWLDFTEGVTPFIQDGVSLNTETYMTMGKSPEQANSFKTHGVDLISVPFRHKYLWGHSLRGFIADIVRT